MDEIAGEPVLRSTLRLLKYSRSKQLAEELGEILRFIVESLPAAGLPDCIRAIGAYVMAVNKSIDSEQYKRPLSSILPTQFEPGSLADRLLIQGREEGREEGMLAGKIQLLQELLEQPVSGKEELASQPLDALQSLLTRLQKQLSDGKS